MTERHPKGSYPLPVVTIDVAQAVRGNAIDLGADYLEQAEARLIANNPDLFTVIGQYVRLSGVADPQIVDLTKTLLVLTHELLLNQAVADAMNPGRQD